MQLGLLSKDFAQLRLSGKAEARALDRIVDRLSRMHGLPQKIGQILSFRELTEDAGRFNRLTEDVSGLEPEEALAEMARQIGACESENGEAGQPSGEGGQGCLDLHFRSVDGTGIAASMGQVHRCVLRSGEEVAVKVQYPDVADQLEADLKALGWLSAPLGDLRRGFDLQGYRSELGNMLRSELDYRREAVWLARFAGWAESWVGIEIPRVFHGLSGRRVLTMSWVEGERFSSVSEWAESERRDVARTMIGFFVECCFRHRCFHADPHSGNYRFRRENGKVTVGLLDFGCVKELESPFVEGFLGLIADLRDGTLEEGDAWKWHVQMGFAMDALAPIRSKLPALSRVLLEPFVCQGEFDLTQWNLGPRMAELLGDHRQNYRVAGPPEAIYLVRAIQGLIQYLKALNVPVSWSAPLEGILLGARRVPLSESPIPVEKPVMKSECLRIRVTENGAMRVDLTFGAGAVDNLPDLVPQHLHPLLKDRSIILEEIVARAQLSDYAPARLFSLEDGSKCVAVWLE